AYSDGGQGYSIAFEKEGLEETFAKGSPAIVLLEQVLYERVQQTDQIRATLEHFRDRLRANGINDSHEILAQLILTLFTTTASFKHPGFIAEEEWRLIWIVRKELESKELLEFSPRHGLVVPFVWMRPKDNSTQLPISSIRIGPNRFPQLAERSL